MTEHMIDALAKGDHDALLLGIVLLVLVPLLLAMAGRTRAAFSKEMALERASREQASRDMIAELRTLVLETTRQTGKLEVVAHSVDELRHDLSLDLKSRDLPLRRGPE